MVAIALEQLLDLQEVVLLSQLDSLVPLVEEHTDVDSLLDVTLLDKGSDGGFAEAYAGELVSQTLEDGRIVGNVIHEFLKVLVVLQLVVSLDEGVIILRHAIELGSLSPLVSLSAVVTQVLVCSLQHLVVAGALLHQLSNSSPVAEPHSQVKSQIFPVNVLVNLLSLIKSLEEGSDFSLLLMLLVKGLEPVHERDSIVVLVVDKGALCDLEVEFVKGCFGDEAPESLVGVLLNILGSVLE